MEVALPRPMWAIRYRQYVDGWMWYWGYGITPTPGEFVPPHDMAVPSDAWTTICDVHDIKVYVGDIVRMTLATGSVVIGEIIWREELTGYGVRYRNRFHPDLFVVRHLYKAVIEVIGNKHENAHLLGEKHEQNTR